MKFSIKDFFSKYDQIRQKLRISTHLLTKSLMENLSFCAVNGELICFLFFQIEDDDVVQDLFNSESRLFWHSFYATLGAIIFILIFGASYEFVRWKCINKGTARLLEATEQVLSKKQCFSLSPSLSLCLSVSVCLSLFLSLSLSFSLSLYIYYIYIYI